MMNNTRTILSIITLIFATPLSGQSQTKIVDYYLPQGLNAHMDYFQQFKPVVLPAGSTCELYINIVENFAAELNLSINKVICKPNLQVKNISYLNEKLGKEICLRMNYAGILEAQYKQYLLLVYQLYSDDYSECITDFIITKIQGDSAILTDVPGYSSNRDLFTLRVIHPGLINSLINTNLFNVSLDSVGESALSLDKFSNLPGRKTDYLSKCGDPRDNSISKKGFYIAINFTENRPYFQRTIYLGDTMTFAPAFRKHGVNEAAITEYRSSKEMLHAFMMAYTPKTIKPLYAEESDSPVLGYEYSQKRSGEDYYRNNKFRPVYSTQLKNSHNLALEAIVFEVLHKNRVVDTRALILKKSKNGELKIFTSFEAYPKLYKEVSFSLSANMDYISLLATKDLNDMVSDIDKILWSAARRPGEKYFDIVRFKNYFYNLSVNSREYKKIMTPVIVQMKNEFW